METIFYASSVCLWVWAFGSFSFHCFTVPMLKAMGVKGNKETLKIAYEANTPMIVRKIPPLNFVIESSWVFFALGVLGITVKRQMAGASLKEAAGFLVASVFVYFVLDLVLLILAKGVAWLRRW